MKNKTIYKICGAILLVSSFSLMTGGVLLENNFIALFSLVPAFGCGECIGRVRRKPNSSSHTIQDGK